MNRGPGNGCRLTTPNYHKIKCWIIIKGILWYSTTNNFTKVLISFIRNTFKVATTYLRVQRVNPLDYFSLWHVQKIQSLRVSNLFFLVMLCYFCNIKENKTMHSFQFNIRYLYANRDQTHMMTSWNGSIFRVTGHLCGEFTGPRWIPHTQASDAELWCLLWAASE